MLIVFFGGEPELWKRRRACETIKNAKKHNTELQYNIEGVDVHAPTGKSSANNCFVHHREE